MFGEKQLLSPWPITFFPGLSKMPSLLTHQGHILDFGKSLTLQCCFDITYDRFALDKVGSVNLKHHCDQCTQSVLYLASFTLDLVNSSTRS